ncbi:hypothetical protein FTV88_0392 [Heliorestis convoluta]|uniref:Uncharacterized protein n=1 Tax=Heliorestis convoluta TaxID=356322 RepID=A0A5Q2MXI0_9FIRM|nr:hypothetical protein FTV88_0392 [Heliorestis convoluta]
MTFPVPLCRDNKRGSIDQGEREVKQLPQSRVIPKDGE